MNKKRNIEDPTQEEMLEIIKEEQNKPEVFKARQFNGIHHTMLEKYLKDFIKGTGEISTNDNIEEDLFEISDKYKEALEDNVDDIEEIKKDLKNKNRDLEAFEEYKNLLKSGFSGEIDYNQFENVIVNNSFSFDMFSENVNDLNERLEIASGTDWETEAFNYETSLEKAKKDQVQGNILSHSNTEIGKIKSEITANKTAYDNERTKLLLVQYIKRQIRLERLQDGGLKEARKKVADAYYILEDRIEEISKSCEYFTTLNHITDQEIKLLIDNMEREMTNISSTMFKSTKYGTGDEFFESQVDPLVNAILEDNKTDNQMDQQRSSSSSTRMAAILKDHKSSIDLPGEIKMDTMLNDASFISQARGVVGTASENNEVDVYNARNDVEELKQLLEAEKKKLENIKANEATSNVQA